MNFNPILFTHLSLLKFIDILNNNGYIFVAKIIVTYLSQYHAVILVVYFFSHIHENNQVCESVKKKTNKKNKTVALVI